MIRHPLSRFGIVLFSFTLFLASTAEAVPTSVTVAGSFQSELGCPGDWQPDCSTTYLTYDANDDVWQKVFAMPAGNWEYKAALNDSWVVNYGANGVQDGANSALALGAGSSVKFYYDDKSHWITDNVNSVIALLAGSFQSELGCPGDWQQDCLRSWLEDVDGDGLYSFVTNDLPAGSYELKIVHDESWGENYGLNGIANGENISFVVPTNFTEVSFIYDPTTHLLEIAVDGGTSVPEPATLTLLGIALAGLAFRRRKRA